MKKRTSFILWFLLFVFLTTYNFDLSEKIKNFPLLVKNIELYGTNNSDKEQIQKKLDKFRGKSLVLIDRRKLKDTIKNSQFVKELKVKKVYPDTIKVNIIEFSPLAVFIEKDKKKYVLTDGKEIIEYKESENFNSLPFVYGKDAEKNFYVFYTNLEGTGFKMDQIERFNYFKINRWDIILKNDKIIRLPSKNYEESISRFQSIYRKENFNNFKVFDFRVKGQLILK